MEVNIIYCLDYDKYDYPDLGLGELFEIYTIPRSRQRKTHEIRVLYWGY